MAITLYYHPWTRAAGVLWMLEEVGVDYALHYLDLMSGEHKAPEIIALNPMGKLPILRDGEAVVSESAAIGLYLADRYASGRLAPALDDPLRATYLRWSLFAPSVLEPGALARASNWDFKPTSAGWGDYDTMLSAMEAAIGGDSGTGPFILGERFSMADVIFGGTLRFMLQFKLVEPRDSFTAYVERLSQRPALQRADRKNAEVVAQKGLAR